MVYHKIKYSKDLFKENFFLPTTVDSKPSCIDSFVIDPSTVYCYKIIDTPRRNNMDGMTDCSTFQADQLYFETHREVEGLYALLKSSNVNHFNLI